MRLKSYFEEMHLHIDALNRAVEILKEFYPFDMDEKIEAINLLISNVDKLIKIGEEIEKRAIKR